VTVSAPVKVKKLKGVKSGTTTAAPATGNSNGGVITRSYQQQQQILQQQQHQGSSSARQTGASNGVNGNGANNNGPKVKPPAPPAHAPGREKSTAGLATAVIEVLNTSVHSVVCLGCERTLVRGTNDGSIEHAYAVAQFLE
jgi:hypothetical protein